MAVYNDTDPFLPYFMEWDGIGIVEDEEDGRSECIPRCAKGTIMKAKGTLW